jgi:pimeloyl-ACP methyl ester carboxylesterase
MTLGKRLALKYVRTRFRVLSALSKKKAAATAFRLFCTPQYRNKKQLPSIFLAAEKLHFRLEGNTVRGYRWNHPAAKKLLILHGFESSVINFERYVKPMIKKGYEVLAFDAPAHGHSSGRQINVVMYKNMVDYIHRKYGPVQSFIAHSLGGLTASLFLEETAHTEAYKLVLIAPATETKTAVDHFFTFFQLDAAVRSEFDRLIEKLGGHPPDWYSVARAAKNIKARVLFLQDKDDQMTPLSDIVPIMKENYSNFQFVISEGLGHRRIYRDHRSLQNVIDFL